MAKDIGYFSPRETDRANEASTTALVAVIGDDLSGVVSVSGELASRGLDTVLQRGLGDPRTDLLSPLFETANRLYVGGAVAVTTDSRHDPPAVAKEKVRYAASALSSTGAAVLIKKVDSLLRGNIGSELAAAMEGSGKGKALCVFAAPSQGRTTVEGNQLVNGELIGQDDPGSYLRSGARGASILELLREEFGDRIHSLGLDVVDQGRRAIRKDLEVVLKEDSADVVVCDSTTTKHVADCVGAAISSGVRLLAGTSDLCGAIADALVAEGQLSHKPPVLVVSGTASQVGRRQVDHAVSKGVVRLVEVSTKDMKMDSVASTQTASNVDASKIEGYVRRASALLGAGENVLVCPKDPPGEEVEASPKVAVMLAEVGAGVIREARVSGVVATGGETAEAVLSLLEAQGLAIGRDIIPGVPEAIILGGPYAGARYVAKTGAYGGHEALEEIVRWLGSCNELFDACVGGAGPAGIAPRVEQEEEG